MPKTDRPTLASRLKAARQAASLSQSQLALKAGLSVDTLQNLEQGRRTRPAVQTLAALARALGVTIENLIGDATMSEQILTDVEIGIVDTGGGYQAIAWRQTGERITTTQIYPTEQEALTQLFHGVRAYFGAVADVVIAEGGSRR